MGSASARIAYRQASGGPWYALAKQGDARASGALSLPCQAQACLRIMALGGRARYNASELAEVLAKHKAIFSTVQEPWAIFRFYKKRLLSMGMILEHDSPSIYMDDHGRYKQKRPRLSLSEKGLSRSSLP